MGHQSFSEKSQTRQVIQLIFDHLAAGSGVTLTQNRGILTIAASGGGGIATIVEGDGIDVDATDPANPIVSTLLSTDVGNTLSFGTDDGLYAAAGAGATDGGITVQVGTPPPEVGAVLSTRIVYFQSPANYTVTGWQAFCDPSATCTFDVWVSAFPTLPVIGDSITGGASIGITTGTSNTGNVTGWSSVAIARGDWVAIVIASNDLATFISFQLQGDKS